jgi:type IX secretion system PorP/SprF family membrane protein
MKRVILLICFILTIWQLQAQNRKQMANFSEYKHYHNPSLTGFDGSVVRSLYRNQWTGFEDAPKTMLATAELDLAMIGKNKGYFGSRNRGAAANYGAKHAIGLTLLHDQFGPFKESQLGLSYGSGIRLNEQLSLRWGTALTYTFHRLDGNSLTLEQENDAKYNAVLGQNNRSSRMDMNLGLALTTARYYIGYGMQDVTAGKVVSGGDDYLHSFYTRRHALQTGYRANVTEQWGFTLNGIYQYDEELKSTVEGQVKAIYQDAFWVGAGYRNDLAYNLTAGIRLNQLGIGYAYESPVQEAQAINRSTNEITLSYNLVPLRSNKQSRQRIIW